MSDSVDRVFVHALATVRRLPRTGSSRPPPASRLRLYGLYKQSMEGDVAAILPRPTLPVSSPDPNSTTGNNNNSVHRYASRDLRTREAQAEIEKWDAWNACAGMSRTEAKRQYISTLIDTMKEYASGTAESRELVSELEFVWNQIKNQSSSGSGSDPGLRGDSEGSPSGKSQKESPTRKLERAGLGPGLERTQSQINSMSFGSNRPSFGSADPGGGSAATAEQQRKNSNGNVKQTRLKRTESGLRVLSPISQRDSDSVVEPVDAAVEEQDNQNYDDNEDNDDDDENLNTAPTSPLANRPQDRGHDHNHNHNPPGNLSDWQHALEQTLTQLKTEIAALREQLSANHLLSSSSYSPSYYALSPRQRILHRAKLYIRTFASLFFKQAVVQLGILVLVVLWGRIRGDLRAEEWVRRVTTRFGKWVKRVIGEVVFWVLDLFGREGRLGFLGRILRVF